MRLNRTARRAYARAPNRPSPRHRWPANLLDLAAILPQHDPILRARKTDAALRVPGLQAQERACSCLPELRGPFPKAAQRSLGLGTQFFQNAVAAFRPQAIQPVFAFRLRGDRRWQDACLPLNPSSSREAARSALSEKRRASPNAWVREVPPWERHSGRSADNPTEQRGQDKADPEILLRVAGAVPGRSAACVHAAR